MDDIPPPPYSPWDPNSSDSNVQSSLPHEFLALSVHSELESSPGTVNHNELPAHQLFPQTGSRVLRPIVSANSQALHGTSNTADLHPNDREDLPQAGFVSAAPYFQTRSPQSPISGNITHHHMVITLDARSDSLSYPQPDKLWLQREVELQDWMTFTNYLLPIPDINDSTSFSEKEGGSGRTRNRLMGHDPEDRRSGPNKLRKHPPHQRFGLESYDDRENERLRRLRIETVLAEWNAAFFHPRCLKVHATIESNWIQNEAHPPTASGEGISGPTNTSDKETLLLAAVARGNKSMVRLILDKGDEEIEARNEKGETALYIATARGDKSIVEMLLKGGASPAARPPNGDTALFIAVAKNRKAIVKLLLQNDNVDLNWKTSTGETALYRAVVRQAHKCIQLLLEKGADVEAGPTDRESMLNIAVSKGDTSTVKLLLEKGANTERRSMDGDTPICRSVARGDGSITKLLLEYGAKVGVRTGKGVSPLSLAVSRGDSSITSLLLQRDDADIEAENLNGETPLYSAVTRGDTSIVVMLLKKGANTAARPENAKTMLNIAVSHGNTSLTSLLLSHGADFEVKNQHDESLLYRAVCKGSSSIVSLLLDAGADPNTKSLKGETALYQAVSKGNNSIASLLLKKGADANSTSPTGDTLLYLSVWRGDTSMASLLIEAGATSKPRVRMEAQLCFGLSGIIGLR
jgi:ankyrin repeat protein